MHGSAIAAGSPFRRLSQKKAVPDATGARPGRGGFTAVTIRHPATLAAISLVLAASTARAQTAGLDPASTARPSDRGVVHEPTANTAPARERVNLGLGVGMASAQDVRVSEAGRSYAFRILQSPALDVSACVRLGVVCLGYGGRFVAAQRVSSIDDVPLHQNASISTVDHAFFLRFEIGSRVRFRPSFAIVVGDERLTLPSVSYEGKRVDARTSLDLALPLGRHAFVLQAGVNMALSGAEMTPRDANGRAVADVDTKRGVGGFIAVGPEFRL